jgi:hypothetical protein
LGQSRNAQKQRGLFLALLIDLRHKEAPRRFVDEAL